MASIDAQRVVAISLGKLASSRSQRGGPQLHKSLLLTTVLHRARTVFMQENMHALIARRQQLCPQQTMVNNSSCDAVEESERPDTPPRAEPFSLSPATNTEPSQQDMYVEEDSESDKENTPVPTVPSAYEGPLPGDCKSDDTVDSMYREPENCEETKVKSSPRCVKRRLTQDNTVESPEKKRLRVGISHRNSCDVTSDSKNTNKTTTPENRDSSTNTEPVQQSDCLQISTLVNKFSSGFSGILGSDCVDHKKGENGLTSSCSRITQVKEGFESISRTVIALTV